MNPATNRIELSVVMPCLNEEEAVGGCIDKIQEVLRRGGIRGEIIVADNGSGDHSVEIARARGAQVVFEQRKGYGAAYLRGLDAAIGEFIVIGDSDATYDFSDIPKFVQPLRDGCDFVIGSRFKGAIKKGAMSWSHRYIGNPVLSSMTRLFFRTALSDIHCGMRAFTREAYGRMRLRTVGMEFATEMVVAALVNHLKIREVPVDYHPRSGDSKLKSLTDAWRHIRFMLLYCPVWLYMVPGCAGFILGLFLLFLPARGPFPLFGRAWDIHLMVFGSVISALSAQTLTLGLCAHTYAARRGFIREDALILFFKRHFNLEKGIVIGLLLCLIGAGINCSIFVEWLSRKFGSLHRIRESIVAMTFLVTGLQTIFSSFFISLLFLERK